MKIPITKAIFDHEEKENILKPLESGWVVQGPFVAEFEKLFSTFTKSPYSLATSNCTTALHLGLIAMGIGENDKVIVPSFTYIASANAVEYTGASVLFCDIDLATFNIDVSHLEQLLKAHQDVKAIMPVHLFGLCADMPAIMDLAKRYNVKVIEDAACAFDSWINHSHAGTFGDCGCFSFHPRKAITTGEGGMLITNQENIHHAVSQLRDHGASKSDLARHQEKGGSLLPQFNMRGYNYRMTDIQGAVGVSQMKKANNIMEGRKQIARQYDQALQQFNEFITPKVPDGYIHGYQSYVCLFTNGEDISTLTIEKIDAINCKRNEFMQRLEQRGIATRQGTHAVHTLNYYKDRYHIQPSDYLMSYAADRLSLTLPVYATMTKQEFDYVIENIREALGQSEKQVA